MKKKITKKNKKKFIIKDWAGNELSRWGKFSSFGDAWDFILGDMTDKLKLEEEDYHDLYVEELEME